MTNCRNYSAIVIFIVLALKGQAQFVNSYTVDNSPLPFNTVRCLEYSNQKLWIGTDYGLAKFENETNWTIYNSTNSPLWNDNIRALKNDGDSLLWIGTIQGGLFKFDGAEWVNYTPENSGIGDFLVRAIEIDQSGHIWAATTEGLYMYDRNTWMSWTRCCVSKARDIRILTLMVLLHNSYSMCLRRTESSWEKTNADQ